MKHINAVSGLNSWLFNVTAREIYGVIILSDKYGSPFSATIPRRVSAECATLIR